MQEDSKERRQNIIASMILNPLLTDSLPKQMHEKLTIYRKPEISQCIKCNSIEDIQKEKNS